VSLISFACCWKVTSAEHATVARPTKRTPLGSVLWGSELAEYLLLFTLLERGSVSVASDAIARGSFGKLSLREPAVHVLLDRLL
jgi:hypothetical protein